MSPPVEPWSLMIPPMKARDWPSGDQLGTASWRSAGGLNIDFVSPVDSDTVYSSAIHQLLSPEPCAAVAAKLFPSRDQSYSYTYRSAGVSCRTSPVRASTVARRCSYI